MKAYELLYFINPALTEEERAAFSARIDATFENIGATVESVDEWGKRKLAYEINNLTEGEYFLVNFQANPESISELDRVLRIIDPVVRFMIVRRDEK